MNNGETSAGCIQMINIWTTIFCYSSTYLFVVELYESAKRGVRSASRERPCGMKHDQIPPYQMAKLFCARYNIL